jgi:hypothetical protein
MAWDGRARRFASRVTGGGRAVREDARLGWLDPLASEKDALSRVGTGASSVHPVFASS